MVRHAGAIGLFAVPDHDAGKLVNGHRPARYGDLSAGVDVFHSVHHGHDLCGGQLADRSDREFHARRASRRNKCRDRPLPR